MFINDTANINMYGKLLEIVNSFKYLGIILIINGMPFYTYIICVTYLLDCRFRWKNTSINRVGCTTTLS